MGIREALFEHLETVAQARFSDAHAYPVGDMPSNVPNRFIVYAKSDNEHLRTLQGGAGKTQSRWDIECLASSAMHADMLAEAVRESLDNKVGDIGGNNTERIVGFVESDSDDFIPPRDKSSEGRHTVALEVTLWYSESVTPI